MRRTLPLIAVGALALSAPFVAACGGDDSGSSASSTTKAGGSDVSSVTVHAKDELKFDSTSYTAKAGEVDFTYINDGSVGHTLKIEGSDKLHLSIGHEDEGKVDLKAGTYTLYCDLPGHEAAGMKATLTVS